MSFLLGPLASLYALAMRARNFAFDRGLRKSFATGVPVLSVGNLSAGGTGKTPITAQLLEDFLKRGLRAGLVSRGYGGTESGPARVTLEGGTADAKRFGDEPAWLAARFPSVPVYVGGDRVADVELMKKENAQPVDLVIADDAFQHRRLKRAFDLVLIDASEPRSHYCSLPQGRLREGFGSLKRASAVFITKTNLAEPAQLAWVRAQVKAALPQGVRALEWESRLTAFADLATKVEVLPESLKGQPVILASGIGRPAAFRKLVEFETGAEILHHLEFSDHHRYTSEDRDKITAKALEVGAKYILITEKDAVKLSDWAAELPVWVSQLTMRPKDSLEGFYEAVNRALF